MVAGMLVDACGVLNVPGAAVLPTTSEGAVRVEQWAAPLILLAIAAWITVLWRDRHPVVVVIAGGILAAIGISYLLLLVGAVAMARREPERATLTGLLVGAGVAVFVAREAFGAWGAAMPWFFGKDAQGAGSLAWILTSIVCAVVSCGAAVGIVVLGRARARAASSDQRADAEHRRADALAEQTVRQAERERIARDMHDALAHRLSVVSLHAGALEAVADADDESGAIARTLREQTHAALQDMRGLIGDLRSGPRDPFPSTMRGISVMLGGLRDAGAALSTYVLIESPERASAQLDSAVHRIVQEALTNAIKHGAGAPIDLFVQAVPSEGARIRVTNSIQSTVATIPGGGHGLIGIRERAAALDGTAWIGEHHGTFIVDVTLPWQERGDTAR